jgi:hypothetical protein
MQLITVDQHAQAVTAWAKASEESAALVKSYQGLICTSKDDVKKYRELAKNLRVEKAGFETESADIVKDVQEFAKTVGSRRAGVLQNYTDAIKFLTSACTAFEQAEKLEKERIEREALEKYNARVDRLTEYCILDGIFFVGMVSFSPGLVQGASEEEFSAMVEKARIEYESIISKVQEPEIDQANEGESETIQSENFGDLGDWLIETEVQKNDLFEAPIVTDLPPMNEEQVKRATQTTVYAPAQTFPHDYRLGFDAFRDRLLSWLDENPKTTRAALLDFIRNEKP